MGGIITACVLGVAEMGAERGTIFHVWEPVMLCHEPRRAVAPQMPPHSKNRGPGLCIAMMLMSTYPRRLLYCRPHERRLNMCSGAIPTGCVFVIMLVEGLSRRQIC
ncbi:unnamed protein product, partial [Ectocarpus sp. 12 AP-2014]